MARLYASANRCDPRVSGSQVPGLSYWTFAKSFYIHVIRGELRHEGAIAEVRNECGIGVPGGPGNGPRTDSVSALTGRESAPFSRAIALGLGRKMTRKSPLQKPDNGPLNPPPVRT